MNDQIHNEESWQFLSKGSANIVFQYTGKMSSLQGKVRRIQLQRSKAQYGVEFVFQYHRLLQSYCFPSFMPAMELVDGVIIMDNLLIDSEFALEFKPKYQFNLNDKCVYCAIKRNGYCPLKFFSNKDEQIAEILPQILRKTFWKGNLSNTDEFITQLCITFGQSIMETLFKICSQFLVKIGIVSLLKSAQNRFKVDSLEFDTHHLEIFDNTLVWERVISGSETGTEFDAIRFLVFKTLSDMSLLLTFTRTGITNIIEQNYGEQRDSRNSAIISLGDLQWQLACHVVDLDPKHHDNLYAYIHKIKTAID